MRPFIAAALALAAVALAACYGSDRLLLDPKEAASPLALGRQTLTDDGGQPEMVDVTRGGDGWYTIKEVGKSGDGSRFLFTPLKDPPPGRWLAFTFSDRRVFIYGVAEIRDGIVNFDLPFCDLGLTRDIAIAHGVKVEQKGAMAPTCTFTTPADLVGALSDYARRPGERGRMATLPAAP